MLTTAVAGAGGVGKSIVEQLVLSGKYNVIVLGRKAPQEAPAAGAPKVIQIDYSNAEALAKVLEREGIHTIISAINMMDPKSTQAQLNLILAAEASGVTKRFVPSEYAFIAKPENVHMDPSIQHWLDNRDALRKTSLQWTRFVNGFFMDYWGMPHMPTGLWPFSWAIHPESRKAALPGDGNDVLTVTYSVDVAKFVVRALEDSDNWPEISVIGGDDVTFNQLLAIAEKVRGSKFEVVYDSAGTLQKNAGTVLGEGFVGLPVEISQQMVCLFGRMTVNGFFKMPGDNRLNAKYPDIKALNATEYFEKAWGGR